MALIGNFDKVLTFIKKNENHPLVKLSIDNVDEIKTYKDFCKIKPLNKSELSKIQQENPPFNNLVNIHKVTKIFQSPGPIYNVKGEDFEHYRFYKALEKAGFNLDDVVLNTFSYHISPAGEMFDDALKKIGAKIFPLGPVSSEQAAEFSEKIGATAFIGTRTFLLKTLEQSKNNKIKKAYLIAEKLTEADRKMFIEKFDVQAFQGYGTAELGLIATEDISFNGMVVDIDTIFLEILEPLSPNPVKSENDMGEIVITFLNETTPFIRLATGDLSYIPKGFNDRIAGIFGRADNSIKIKGVFVHFWQLDELSNKLNTKLKLIADTDENGLDFLKIYMSKNVDIKTEFKKTFGLKLSIAEIDDKIEKTEIIDNRKRLQEK